jgi:biotin carboxyl carrier protein
VTSIPHNLTQSDVTNLIRLVDALHGSTLRFLRIETEGLQISISKDDGTTAEASIADGCARTSIPSTSVGIFRAIRSESGTAAELGSPVVAGKAVGAVHTLGEVHLVKAPSNGIIVAVQVKDGDFVEYGQVLFSIDPDGRLDT